MASFVIAKKGLKILDTPVFHAGSSGDQEALAVFSDTAAADRYIRAAGWTEGHEVGELDQLQMLRWLVKAEEEGIRYLAVDPIWSDQMAGNEQQVLAIHDELAAAAESLSQQIFGHRDGRK